MGEQTVNLVCVAGPLMVQSIPMGPAEAIIGRDPARTVVLPDTGLAPRHASLVLESRNGTFINGVPVCESQLGFGYALTLGGSVFLSEANALSAHPGSFVLYFKSRSENPWPMASHGDPPQFELGLLDEIMEGQRSAVRKRSSPLHAPPKRPRPKPAARASSSPRATTYCATVIRCRRFTPPSYSTFTRTTSIV